MSTMEKKWHVLRSVDVNHQPGLIRQLMLARKGFVGKSIQAWMVEDKFKYLKGRLDEENHQLSESMGKKLHSEHPFIPRPDVWQIELMKIVRKGWCNNGEFKADNLLTWEKEFLCLGEAFDKNYIDSDNGVWKRMFRIQMILKKGLDLSADNQAFHDQIVSAIPDSIKKMYKLI